MAGAKNFRLALERVGMTAGDDFARV